MDFCHLIVTCLFSMLRLPFDNQKVKGNYAIFSKKPLLFQFLLDIEFGVWGGQYNTPQMRFMQMVDNILESHS